MEDLLNVLTKNELIDVKNNELHMRNNTGLLLMRAIINLTFRLEF